ncbi:MAG: hypothetical protein HY927_11215 [Elusimicrobia bacterium]|nr:hypothetical protein [Elusimicrobiota bacterium]
MARWVFLAALVAVVGVCVWRFAPGKGGEPGVAPSQPTPSSVLNVKTENVFPSVETVDDLLRKAGKEYAGQPEKQAAMVKFFEPWVWCMGFQAGSPVASPNICDRLEPLLSKDRKDTCRISVYEGFYLWEAFHEAPGLPACRAFLPLVGSPESAASALCENGVPLVRKGDLDGICRVAVEQGLLPKPDQPKCKEELGFLAGNPDVCRSQGEKFRFKCEQAAPFVRAMRENNPSLAAETAYAPFFRPGDKSSCASLERKGLEQYKAFVAANPPIANPDTSKLDAQEKKRWEEYLQDQAKLKAEGEREAEKQKHFKVLAAQAAEAENAKTAADEARVKMEREKLQRLLELKAQQDQEKRAEQKKRDEEKAAALQAASERKQWEDRLQDEMAKSKEGAPLENRPGESPRSIMPPGAGANPVQGAP